MISIFSARHVQKKVTVSLFLEDVLVDVGKIKFNTDGLPNQGGNEQKNVYTFDKQSTSDFSSASQRCKTEIS
jgi:hypothetical protein